jgi:hypothetical protein
MAFYRSQGAGYHTRINETLRAAMRLRFRRKRKARQQSDARIGYM